MPILPDVERLLGELERFRLLLTEIAVKITEAERANAERFRALCDTAELYGKEILDRIGEEDMRRIRAAEQKGWTE